MFVNTLHWLVLLWAVVLTVPHWLILLWTFFLDALPYLLILLGIFLRTFLPFWRKVLYHLRDESALPKFEKRFWVPPLATLGIDLTAFLLGWLVDPSWTEGLGQLHWSALIIIGVGGHQTVREIQRWFEREPA